MTPNKALEKLKTLCRKSQLLNGMQKVLEWDEATVMPAQEVINRGNQKAVLIELDSNIWTSKRTEKLLQQLVPEYLTQVSPTELAPRKELLPDSAIVYHAYRRFDREGKVPVQLSTKFIKHCSECYEAWNRAREANDFNIVKPHLVTGVKLSQEIAACYDYAHPLDALITELDPDLTVAKVDPLFQELAKEIVPRVESWSSRNIKGNRGWFLPQYVNEDKQWELAKLLATDLTFDWNRGYMGKTPHPFTDRSSKNDTRFSARTNPKDLRELVYCITHEVGHALYEQHFPFEWDGLIIDNSPSMSMHESQSRFLEICVGFDPAFMVYLSGHISKLFGVDVTDKDLINPFPVSRSPTRLGMDTDPVSYLLHIFIRYELEKGLLDGSVPANEIRDAWNDMYQKYLGITPPDDLQGILQDVHWYSDTTGGYFQSYAVGTIMAAGFWNAAQKQLPSLKTDMAQGNFTQLSDWLKSNIHQHGASLSTFDIYNRVAKEPLSIQPLINHFDFLYNNQ